MEKGQSSDTRKLGVIVDAAAGAIGRLSATTNRVVYAPGETTGGDDAMTRRVFRAIAMSETIRSNCRAAITRPDDMNEAEEAAMLVRAQRLLAHVLEAKWPRPPPSDPN